MSNHSPSINSGLLPNMLFTVSIVSSVHPQSPAAAKLKPGKVAEAVAYA
jgi:hypothetical protein